MTRSNMAVFSASREDRGCTDCLFFDSKRKRCGIGIKNCILNESDSEEESDFKCPKSSRFSGCEDCQFGRERPCVSLCMQEVMKKWRRKRKGRPG